MSRKVLAISTAADALKLSRQRGLFSCTSVRHLPSMNILIKPVITEKMTDESEKFNRFGFIVDRRANKLEIKDAIEKMYGVSVEKVRTMVYPGKAKSRNTKGGVISGRTNSYKKAIVDVAEGESIDFYGNI